METAGSQAPCESLEWPLSGAADPESAEMGVGGHLERPFPAQRRTLKRVPVMRPPPGGSPGLSTGYLFLLSWRTG